MSNITNNVNILEVFASLKAALTQEQKSTLGQLVDSKDPLAVFDTIGLADDQDDKKQVELPHASIRCLQDITDIFDSYPQPLCESRETNLKRLTKLFNNGILNPLDPATVFQKILDTQKDLKQPKAKYNAFSPVGTLLRAMKPETLGLAPAAYEQLHKAFTAYAKDIKKPYDDMRRTGQRSEHLQSVWHDYSELKAKFEELYRALLVMNNSTKKVSSEKRKDFTVVVFALSSFLMCNTRSALLSVKTANFDVKKDNYILFNDSGDKAVIVWNKRKTGMKRFVQTVPEEYCRVLYDYNKRNRKHYPASTFLFCNTNGGAQGAQDIQKYLRKLTITHFGKAIGISVLRRIQIHHLGQPATANERFLLAQEFHHSAYEHDLYMTVDGYESPAEPDSEDED